MWPGHRGGRSWTSWGRWRWSWRRGRASGCGHHPPRAPPVCSGWCASQSSGGSWSPHPASRGPWGWPGWGQSMAASHPLQCPAQPKSSHTGLETARKTANRALIKNEMFKPSVWIFYSHPRISLKNLSSKTDVPRNIFVLSTVQL